MYQGCVYMQLAVSGLCRYGNICVWVLSALQTLVKGLSLQVKKEKARLQKELDQVMDEAYNILHRR